MQLFNCNKNAHMANAVTRLHGEVYCHGICVNKIILIILLMIWAM